MIVSPRLVSAFAIVACLVASMAACKNNANNNRDAAVAIDAPPDAVPDAAIDAPVAPLLRNPVALGDGELGLQALRIIGANVDNRRVNCQTCHSVARQQLRYWRTMFDFSTTSCMKDPMLSSKQSALNTINCFRSDPIDHESPFKIAHLGIYATAAQSRWFEFAFWRAYDDGTDAWKTKYAQFKSDVQMPRGGATLLSQEDFDIVAEYYARGLPQLDSLLPVEQTGPEFCTAGISAEVKTTLDGISNTGWRQIHKDNHLSMLGCQGAATAKDCLTSFPLANSSMFDDKWDIQGLGRMRILRELNYHTSYWSRASADGRFFGHGGGANSSGSIVDFQADRVIPVAAPYDPGFFPDNGAFMFQATSGGGAKVCSQSLLTNNPTSVTFSEPQCGDTSAGLYQHVGKATEQGGDYFIVSGCWQGDPASGVQRNDPPTTRDQTCDLDFDAMINQGTGFDQKTRTTISTPFEGDTVISPSAKLVISRVAGPNQSQLGYVLRKVNATPNGTGYDITAPEIARYCVKGAKPAFSYDDRWLVYHHYINDSDAVSLGFTGAADPDFAQYRIKGAANVYLMDLRTGVTTRVTNMQPGQYALFPSFRADGWLYILVKDRNRGIESAIASPAALFLEQ
jgi:hypothetical protein